MTEQPKEVSWKEFVKSLPVETLSKLSAWIASEARSVRMMTGDRMLAVQIGKMLDDFIDDQYQAENAIQAEHGLAEKVAREQ